MGDLPRSTRSLFNWGMPDVAENMVLVGPWHRIEPLLLLEGQFLPQNGGSKGQNTPQL